MVKIDSFLITLDNTNRVFYAGQAVAGKVILVTRDVVKLRNIRLKVDGHAKTHWTEQRNHGGTTANNNTSNTETIHFTAEQEYINFDIILMGQPKGYGSGSNTQLPSGTHQFSFQFQLPAQCATSFEGVHGHIRYALTAIVDRPWKFDHTSKLPITVIAPYDLNYDMTARDPIKATNQKTLGALFWKSGDLAANVFLKHRGFVAGQPINPVIEVMNESKKVIKKVKLQLKQTTVFHAYHHHRKSRSHTRTVAESNNDVDIPANANKTVTFSNFSVPPVPPVIINCSIIEIFYEFFVSLSPSGMSFDLDLKIPIIIGTVPVMENVSQPLVQNAYTPQNPYPDQSQQAPPRVEVASNSQMYPQIPGPGGYPPGTPANYPPQPYSNQPVMGGGIPPPGTQLDAQEPEAGMDLPPSYDSLLAPQGPVAYPGGPPGGLPGGSPRGPPGGLPVGPPGGHAMPSAPPMPQDAYPDLAPPNFQECVTGRTNIREDHEKHTYGDLSFAPSYPCYNLPVAPPAVAPQQPANPYQKNF